MRKIAILLCGGAGSRMGSCVPKQFLKLDDGLTVLAKSVLAFVENPNIDQIIVVAKESLREQTIEIMENLKLDKPWIVVNGGETRQQSSLCGVNAVENPQDDDIILIHDVARPFVSRETIDNTIKAMTQYRAVSTIMPSSDTIYILNEKREIQSIPERKNLCNVQTPQVFHYNLIKKAHLMAQEIGKTDFTDDSGMVHYFSLAPVGTVLGSVENKKITYPSDL